MKANTATQHVRKYATTAAKAVMRRMQMNIRNMLGIACVAVLGFTAGSAQAVPFNPSGWGYSMPITFTNDTRLNTLTNFTALVVLDTNKVTYSQFLANAQDLRFADTNGTELAYQVESWNTASNSHIWVKIPTLVASGVITAYWANAGAPLPAYRTNGLAWDSTFAGVWHLGETGNTTAGGYKDSTANTNDATGVAMTAGTEVAAQIYKGQNLNGTSQEIDAADSTSLRPGTAVSMSVWIKAVSIASSHTHLMHKRGTTATTYGLWTDPSKKLYFETAGGALTGNTVLNVATWYHVAATYDGSNMQVYLNGVQDNSKAQTGAIANGTTTLPLRIGHGPFNNWFNGIMDEPRVSNVGRSANWIWAEYANVAQQSMFVTYGTPSRVAPSLASSGIVDDKNGGPIDTGTVVTYTVTFSQDMDAGTVSAADFGNAGTAGISIGTVTETSSTSGIFTVPVTTTSAGTLQLKVNAGAVLSDVWGLPLNTASAIADDTTLVVADITDTTPPTLTSIVDDKGGGTTERNTLVTYTVTFSEDMNASTVSAADFGNAGTAAVTINSVTETAPTSGVFTVQATPTSSGTLQLQVKQSAELKDVAGNALVTTSAILDDTTITVDATPPTIATLSPVDNAIGVVTIANLVVTFNEAITIGTGDITIKNLTDNSQTTIAITNGSPQVSVSGAVLTIKPTADLAPTKSYAIQIGATAIKDVAGNNFAGIADDTTWNFTTARILADARSDFRTTTAGGTTADFNGGTGISDTEKSGRWNYLNGATPTLLTFGTAGNAGKSMYQTTGQTNGLPAIGDQQIFRDVPAPAAGKIQWHVGATTAQSAVMRWTAGANVTNLAIAGNIARGVVSSGYPKFDILVNGVNCFTISSFPDTALHTFNVTGLSIRAGQQVQFIFSITSNNANSGAIADMQAVIYGDLPRRGTLIRCF